MTAPILFFAVLPVVLTGTIVGIPWLIVDGSDPSVWIAFSGYAVCALGALAWAVIYDLLHKRRHGYYP